MGELLYSRNKLVIYQKLSSGNLENKKHPPFREDAHHISTICIVHLPVAMCLSCSSKMSTE